MLLERTDLERRLADIVATNMPGHGGDSLDPEAKPPQDPSQNPPEDEEPEEQPS